MNVCFVWWWFEKKCTLPGFCNLPGEILKSNFSFFIQQNCLKAQKKWILSDEYVCGSIGIGTHHWIPIIIRVIQYIEMFMLNVYYLKEVWLCGFFYYFLRLVLSLLIFLFSISLIVFLKPLAFPLNIPRTSCKESSQRDVTWVQSFLWLSLIIHCRLFAIKWAGYWRIKY